MTTRSVALAAGVQAPTIDGAAAAAVTLRAAVDDLAALSAAERVLLGEWLDRIASA